MFVSERKRPMTSSNVRKRVFRLGQAAGVPFPVHPHVSRHTCGFKLTNDGHDMRAVKHYFGHKNIQRIVRFTEWAAN